MAPGDEVDDAQPVTTADPVRPWVEEREDGTGTIHLKHGIPQGRDLPVLMDLEFHGIEAAAFWMVPADKVTFGDLLEAAAKACRRAPPDFKRLKGRDIRCVIDLVGKAIGADQRTGASS